MRRGELSEVIGPLRAAKKIAIMSHYNPDPDALGSSCGLGLGLGYLGAEVSVINDAGALPRYQFIPGVSQMLSDFDPAGYDIIVTCDCGDLKRVGDRLVEKLQHAKCLINIDHHLSNACFGHLNLVVEEASSTSEIVYEILEGLKVPLDSQIATALFAGIMGDTGSFRYASATAKTFLIARCLVLAGAKPDIIAQVLYSNNSIAAVRLHGEALSRMKLHAGGRICELHVSQELIDQCQAKPGDTEDLVEKGRDIEGVQVAFLARWEKGIWYVSLRSRSAAYDVSEVARSLGGGGHKSAAAFRWRQSFEDLHPQLIEKLEKLFR